MKNDHLFEPEGPKRPRHGNTRALVPLGRSQCPECGGDVHETSAAQPALIRHGGYGETKVGTYLHCDCGWMLDAAQTSESPRRLAQ